VAIQIVIRPQGDSPAAVFAPGELLSFAGGPVRVGGDAGCECRLAGAPALAATLRERPGGGWELEAAPEIPWLVNGQPASERCAIGNGDELGGCGRTLHFHHLLPPVPYSRRADALALLAKGLIVLILVAEVLLVAWLPRQIRMARLWEDRIAKQKAVLLVDDLRERNHRAVARTPAEQTARQFVGQRLDELARRLRRYQQALSRDQLRAVTADLELYQEALTALDDGRLFKAVPALPVDAALRGVLENRPATP
jgi:hypothetical protein